jgi:Putative auto-transporter adhesin, head GIN domain
MKKNLMTFFLAATVGFAMAQQSEVRNVGSFTGVKAAEGIDVYLKKGDKESVRVEVNGDTDLSNIITEVSGAYLKIHMRGGRFNRNIYAKVYVTYRMLDKISASSAANVYTEGVLSSRDLELGCSSAASIGLNIEVDELVVGVSSAGDVELKGKARSAEFELSSAGEVDAYDLDVDILSVDASSAASAKVSVIKELNAQASSGANIRYKGDPPKSRTDSSSGGSVKKSY